MFPSDEDAHAILAQCLNGLCDTGLPNLLSSENRFSIDLLAACTV